MCCEDFPLKVIATSCVFIMVADSLIFKQLWVSEGIIESMAVPEVYHECYKPQIRMRMVFTGYAINAAFTCFLLTISLIVFEEMSPAFGFVINFISDYMYIVFGPVLITFSIAGLMALPGIALDCHLDYVGTHFRVTDVFCLLLCLLISFLILFLYGVQITGKLASHGLADETSIYYQIFYKQLNKSKKKYLDEKEKTQQSRRFEVLRLRHDTEETESLLSRTRGGSEDLNYNADASEDQESR